MKEFEKYVKLAGSDQLHSTLFTISSTCTKISNETEHLKSLESEKYEIYANARGESRNLLSDLKHLNKYLGEPQAFTITPSAPAPVKKKAVKRPVARRRVPKKATRAPTRRAPVKKAPTRRKPVAKPKAAPRVAAKKAKDTENLRRLKANLDAIRSSLK